jgi:GDP-4-dehydro-6-deoxy-D-mannose reductase
MAEIQAGLRSPRLQVGNLDARRDLTDVRDVVRAYLLLQERGEPGAVYNVCTGLAPSVQEVLSWLIALTGIEIEIAVEPGRLRPSDLDSLTGQAEALRARTGWTPEIPLQRTLTDLLAYWVARCRAFDVGVAHAG